MSAPSPSLPDLIQDIQQQLSLHGLSFLHLTPISFSNQWQYLSFNHGFEETLATLHISPTLTRILKLLIKQEGKLVSSLKLNHSMASNAFSNGHMSADWNHTILQLAVFDRICWVTKNRHMALGDTFYCSPPSETERDSDTPQSARWKEEAQRFCRLTPMAANTNRTRDYSTEKELNDDLLSLALSPGASLASRFAQAALGIRALEVSNHSASSCVSPLTSNCSGCRISGELGL